MIQNYAFSNSETLGSCRYMSTYVLDVTTLQQELRICYTKFRNFNEQVA